jgi:hypothetical protein
MTHLLYYYYEVVKEPCVYKETLYTNAIYLAVGSNSGDDRDRTGDLWLAKPPLSQLSYIPVPIHTWA